jgi:hypothetical protein
MHYVKSPARIALARRFFSAYLCALCVTALSFAFTAQAQVPTPGRGSTAERNLGAYRPPKFEFHSNFWLNLHHFLYHQARLRQVSAEDVTNSPSQGGLALNIKAVKPEELSADEQAPWKEALDYYAENLSSRDLLFNGDLVNINNRLAEWEKQPDLSLSGLRAGLIAAMQKAAPAYRAHWWAEHDRANRAWIAALEPRVARMGSEVGVRLAAAYQAQWPVEVTSVDVSYYANWAGAYTTDDPLHITISSSDPRNQNEGALEILYHEASHGLTRHVRDAIARECRSRNKPIPRDLWHALLFYTTGEMVKRVLALQPGGAHDYVPYAYQNGLYARSWPQFQPLLERYWQPYLDGKIDFDAAISRMVSNL